MGTKLSVLAVFFYVVASPALADPPSDAQAHAKIQAFKDAMTGDAASQKSAIASLAECIHPACVTQLAPLVRTGDDEVRIAAAEALGRMQGLPDPGKALQVAIEPNVRRPAVLAAIMKGFGTLNDASAVPLLRDYALNWLCSTDATLGVALYAAIEGLGEIRSKSSMEALVAIRAKTSGGPGQGPAVRGPATKHVAAAVEKLTGLKPPAGDLAKWWKACAARFADDMTPVGAGKVQATKK